MSDFYVGQFLKCIRIPRRHKGYFSLGNSYRIAAIDSGDTKLPLLMDCDTTITLWCESSAFTSDLQQAAK